MMASPIRSCVCCGKKSAKALLVRFVWRGTAPQRDERQRATGRGAYCCSDGRCVEMFFKQSKRWKKAFRL